MDLKKSCGPYTDCHCQTHLLTHTSQLAHRLTFFTFLEKAQRTLNTPDADLVLSESFLPMVKRLDECLGYLGEHVSGIATHCLCSEQFEDIFLILHRIAARLQRFRAISYPLPAMHDSKYGSDQNILRQQYQIPRTRGVQANGRQSECRQSCLCEVTILGAYSELLL